MKKNTNVWIGIILSIIIGVIIIYSIEYNKSFLQISIAYLVFILPGKK